MLHTTSADGTSLAYDRIGSGPALVLIGGGPTTRAANAELAQLLATSCTVYNYDRRGHGDSDDTQSFTVDQEFQDVQAMLDVAGGQAAVFGSSGGAVIALQAAIRGLAITRLALWEPAYVVEGTRRPVPGDYAARLAELIASGRRSEAGEMFFADAVGVPQQFIDEMLASPFWPTIEAVAHTLVYDAQLMGDFAVPVQQLRALQIPTLVVDGATTPWLSTSADAVAAAIGRATRETLAGQQHNVQATALAPTIAAFLVGGA